MSPQSEPIKADYSGYMRLSAVLLVAEVLMEEFSDGTEFHADCLALGLCGDMFPVQIYDRASEPRKIERLKEFLQPDNLVSVQEEIVDVCGRAIRLMGPNLQPFVGNADNLRRNFKRKQGLPGQRTGARFDGSGVAIEGLVTKCCVLPTQNSGPMAIATVETVGGPIEAVLFPEIYERYQSVVAQLGLLKFNGQYETETDLPGPNIMVIKEISRI